MNQTAIECVSHTVLHAFFWKTLMTTSGIPKYQQVADTLEVLIHKGKLDDDKMPSVRGVAKQFSISIVTASRALQVLRDKGVVRSVERSGTFLLPAATAERWALIMHVTHGTQAELVTAQVRNGFETVAHQQSIHVHTDAFRIERDLTVERATEAAKRAMASGILGVFLLPSRASDAEAEAEAAFLAGCNAAGMPVVLLERYLRKQLNSTEWDLVAQDDFLAGVECTRHLIERGRKRIAIAVASPTSTHQQRLAGYMLELHNTRTAKSKRATEYPVLVAQLPEELPSLQVSQYLGDYVAKHEVDAIICYHDYAAIGLWLELAHRGITVPNDVAMIGFENMPFAAMSAIGLSTYDYPGSLIAEEALRIMRERRKSMKRLSVRIVVPSRLIVRASTDTASV